MGYSFEGHHYWPDIDDFDESSSESSSGFSSSENSSSSASDYGGWKYPAWAQSGVPPTHTGISDDSSLCPHCGHKKATVECPPPKNTGRMFTLDNE